jgi:hypothetical protein
MTAMSQPRPAFAAGQCWAFRSPEGYDHARLIIGAILRFDGQDDVACVSITAAPQRRADGSRGPAPILLLPLTLAALAATVTDYAGEALPPAGFANAFAAWHDDDRGVTFFTVPFDGHLDRLIARQMSAIAAD